MAFHRSEIDRRPREDHVAFASLRALRVRTKEAPPTTTTEERGKEARTPNAPSAPAPREDDLEHRRLGSFYSGRQGRMYARCATPQGFPPSLKQQRGRQRLGVAARRPRYVLPRSPRRHHVLRHFQIGFCLQRRSGVRILRTVATHQRPIGRVLHQRSVPAVPLVLNRNTVAAAMILETL